jgi:hypothetical protein
MEDTQEMWLSRGGGFGQPGDCRVLLGSSADSSAAGALLPLANYLREPCGGASTATSPSCLQNARVVKFLTQHYAEILTEFQKIVDVKSAAA